MDKLLELFTSSVTAFGDRVHAVREGQWGAPTPDTDWSVADLVGHLIEEQQWVPPLLDGLDLDAAGKIVAGTRDLPVEGGVGANLAQVWDEAAIGSLDAFARPGALDRQVHLSRGLTPARGYLGELIIDLVVHGWDLGAAIEYPEPLPSDAVSYAYEQVSVAGDMSGYGLFEPPVEVPESASLQGKLIGLTGRNPAWSSPG